MLFVGLGVGVLIWRVLAYRDPAALVTIPDELRLPMAALGIFFAVCGLAAWMLRPGPATALFCLHGLCAGVHWGGSIGGESKGMELALFFDAGNSFTNKQGFDLSTLRKDVGFEVRFYLPIFGAPIRLIYGWVLDPLPGQSDTDFIFSIGTTF